MTDWKYPTAFSSWDDEEDAAIERVRRSGRWTMGPEVEAFEREFADWHGMKHGVMTNSGSSANLVAVAALHNILDKPLRLGHGAAVPAIAWSTTYAPLVQTGLQLALSDVDDTWNATWELDGARAAGCRLWVACSVLGNACRMPPTDEFVIEDNCESLGARDHTGLLAGTRGHLNTFSLFYSHQVSAVEGGVILTNDDTLAFICRVLRAHGWSRDVREPGEGPPPFHREYEFLTFGYNVRPLELHAAVARVQLRKLPWLIAGRRSNHRKFKELTKGLPIRHPREVGESSPFGLPFCVERAELRQVLVDALRAAGIDARQPTGGSFLRHPYGAPWRSQSTPQADLIHDAGLFLGNPPWVADAMIEKATQVMRRVL